MTIKYFDKAKEFNDIEYQCAHYYVGVGDKYTSKDGTIFVCIQDSPPGYFDVLCHFEMDDFLKMKGNVNIPKIWFFLDDFLKSKM